MGVIIFILCSNTRFKYTSFGAVRDLGRSCRDTAPGVAWDATNQPRPRCRLTQSSTLWVVSWSSLMSG